MFFKLEMQYIFTVDSFIQFLHEFPGFYFYLTAEEKKKQKQKQTSGNFLTQNKTKHQVSKCVADQRREKHLRSIKINKKVYKKKKNKKK